MTHLATPSRLTAVLALTACLGILGQPVAAQDDTHKVMTADDVTFGAGPPSLPAGIEMAVLSGHPGQEGLVIIRLKFPAGSAIPPHTHAKDERVTVISGRLGIAMGDTLDRDAAPLLEAGSFVQMSAEMTHFAWADEETVVQLTGMGPFDIKYVQDADDPRIN